MKRLRVTGFLYFSYYLLIEVSVESKVSIVIIGAEAERGLPKRLPLKLGASRRAR